MKAISLSQPWASLIAAGAKIVETRAWPCSYRGEIAVHAAKTFPPEARGLAFLPQFREPLEDAGYHLDWDYRADRRRSAPLDHDLPLGAVVAIARLVRCVRVEEIRHVINAQERAFGNYEDGRWAFVLADVERLAEPIPATGALGVWCWQPELDWQAVGE